MSFHYEIQQETIGFTAGHKGQLARKVLAITLTIDDIALTVWNYGATLVALQIPDKDGQVANVVQCLPDLAAYEADNAYVGATIGRYARCVANGRFRMGRREYQLDRNLCGHHFHGGGLGFHRYVWDAETGHDGDTLFARFRHQSADGDQGYPGAVEVFATYRIHPGRKLTIEYEGRTLATTVIGLTSHAFWSLSGEGRIDRQELRLTASQVIKTDFEHIPKGPPQSVTASPLDFRVRRKIGPLRLDNCFLIDHASAVLDLRDRMTGRRLIISTDQPGLALYSGERLAKTRGGLCIQPTALPDAPNRPDFPSVLLEPGDIYRSRTLYEFECDSASQE